MRRIVSLLVVCLLVAAAAAQENTKYKAGARLVLVPAVVKDKSGNHIPGLTKDSFKITQDGKEQPVAVFEEVKVIRERIVPVETKQPEFSNIVTDLAKPRALTVIAFDGINTPVLAMTQVKQDLLKLISQMAEHGDPTALVTLEPGRARVVYDFTTDPKVIAQALKKLQVAPPMGQNNMSQTANNQAYLVSNIPDMGMSAEGFEKLQRQLTAWITEKVTADYIARAQQRQIRRDTLSAIRNLAAALKSFPGRKNLIWVTGGFPYSEDNIQLQDPREQGMGTGVNRNTNNQRPANAISGGPGSAPTSGSPTSQGSSDGGFSLGAEGTMGATSPAIMRGVPNTEAIDDHTKTWGLLNDANVAVYPIDARRLVNTAFDVVDTSQKYSSQGVDREMSYSKQQEVITTFENIASATGGKPCFGRADLANCFKEALDDGDSYYMLGYYVPDKTKAGWHKLQVKAAAKDTNIRARNGFLYADVPLDARPAIQEELASAVASPMNALAVPFRGAILDTVDRNGKKAVQFLLNLPLQSFTVDAQNANHIHLDVVAVAFGPDGKPAGNMGQTIDTKLKPEAIAQIEKGGLSYKNAIELAPGDYQVRFVVRDNLSGRIGSVFTAIKVQ